SRGVTGRTEGVPSRGVRSSACGSVSGPGAATVGEGGGAVVVGGRGARDGDAIAGGDAGSAGDDGGVAGTDVRSAGEDAGVAGGDVRRAGEDAGVAGGDVRSAGEDVGAGGGPAFTGRGGAFGITCVISCGDSERGGGVGREAHDRPPLGGGGIDVRVGA